jgi:hypothetical protein
MELDTIVTRVFVEDKAWNIYFFLRPRVCPPNFNRTMIGSIQQKWKPVASHIFVSL